MKKMKYTEPEMELLYFDTEDVITTSEWGEDPLPDDEIEE